MPGIKYILNNDIRKATTILNKNQFKAIIKVFMSTSTNEGCFEGLTLNIEPGIYSLSNELK
jgi:hypothetical protein